MKIAVDFDGTLWEHYGIPGPNIWLIETLKALQARGSRLILWTCRYPGNGLEEAVRVLEARGLFFDAVNDNLPEVKSSHGDSRKVLADLYIDDRTAHPTVLDPLLVALSAPVRL